MVLLRNSTLPSGYEPRRIELLRKLLSNRCLIHSACDSAESIATSPDLDLEDKQLRKMRPSPLKIQEREEHEGQTRACHSERESLMINSSQNPKVSGKPDAKCVQKREANEHLLITQTRKLETSFSRDPEVSGKPDAVFSRQNESRQNTFRKRQK